MWGQHTELKARPGKRDELINKFAEAATIQADNPDCLLLVASKAMKNDQSMFVTEIYANKETWLAARSRPEITAWSQGIPDLVEGKISQTEFTPVAGKGLEKTGSQDAES